MPLRYTCKCVSTDVRGRRTTQKYLWGKGGQKRGRKNKKGIDIETLWIDLENGMPISKVARGYKTTPKTLRLRLRRINGKKYRKIMEKYGRGPRVQNPVPETIWKRLEDGETLPKLAEEYKIEFGTLCSRLRRTNEKRYRATVGDHHRQLMIKIKRAKLRTPAISEIWRRLEGGEPLARLAKEYRINHGTLSCRLRQFYGRKYKEVMDKRRARIPPVSEILRRSEGGEPLTKLAERYRISRRTLSRRLQQEIGKERYEELDKRRAQIPPIFEILRRLEDGQLLTKLAREYKVTRNTLSRRLQEALGKEKYKEIMKVKYIKQRPYPKQLYPNRYALRRKLERGAESRLELEILRILEERDIQFEFHVSLKMGRRKYAPDFMLSRHTIIEAAGVTFRHYWEYYRKKIRYYVRHGYTVIVVVPNNLRRRAEEYLPRHWAAVIRIKDFERKIDEILEQTSTILKRQQTFNDNTYP